MYFSTIKKILLFGIFLVIFSTLLELIIMKNHIKYLFLLTSFIGQGIFLFGLFLLNKKVKSLLLPHYIFIVCISFILDIFLKTNIHQYNSIAILFLILFLLFVIFRYLQIFASISNQKLFLYSFYVFIISLFVGVFVLKIGNFTSPFIIQTTIAFITLPALIIYIAAIFSLHENNFTKNNQEIYES